MTLQTGKNAFASLVGGFFPGSAVTIPPGKFKLSNESLVDSFRGSTTTSSVNSSAATYMRSSKFAYRLFNQDGTSAIGNWPVLDNQYFVRFNFNPLLISYVQKYFTNYQEDVGFLQFLVKTVNPPTSKIKTEKLNQYNRKVISQTNIDFSPTSMTFFDIVDGKTQKIWEMYYNYYFKDGLSDKFENIAAGTTGRETNIISHNKDIFAESNNPANETGFGYNLEEVKNEKYLIESIDIFHMTGKTYKVTHLIHPRIEDFQQKTLSYESGDVSELTFSFLVENVLYQNKGAYMTFDDTLVTQAMKLMEMTDVFDLTIFADYAASASRPRQYDMSGYVIDQKGKNITGRSDNQGQNIFGNITQQLGIDETSILGKAVTGVEKRVTSVVNGLPNQIANSVANGVLTGEFKFKPDLKQIGKNIIKQETNAMSNRVQNTIKSTVKNTTKDIIGGILTGKGSGGI